MKIGIQIHWNKVLVEPIKIQSWQIVSSLNTCYRPLNKFVPPGPAEPRATKLPTPVTTQFNSK